jgi:hypothetical protein
MMKIVDLNMKSNIYNIAEVVSTCCTLQGSFVMSSENNQEIHLDYYTSLLTKLRANAIVTGYNKFIGYK